MNTVEIGTSTTASSVVKRSSNFGYGVKLVLFVAILLTLGVFARVSTTYWQSVCVLLSINIIMVMGYRVITLMGGWSFAHVATMGLGAYTTALMITASSPWPFWFAILASGIVCALFAAIVSYPVLRTRTFYFVLSTFAAGEAIVQSFIQFRDITGGTNGIAFLPRPQGFLFFEFESTIGYLNLVLAITFVLGTLALKLDASRLGDTIRAVAMNEDLSESLGIDTWRMRSLAFVVGSVMAGIAGSLFAVFNAIINPGDFSSTLMFKYVAASIVGGVTTFFGPILGLFFLTALEEAFRNALSWVPLLWGIAVLVSVLGLRGGIDTLILAGWAKLRGKRAQG